MFITPCLNYYLKYLGHAFAMYTPPHTHTHRMLPFKISRGLETRMQTLCVQTLHLVSLLVLAQSNQTFPGPIASGISAAVRRPCMEINTW